MITDTTRALGAIEISRTADLDQLSRAIALPARFD